MQLVPTIAGLSGEEVSGGRQSPCPFHNHTPWARACRGALPGKRAGLSLRRWLLSRTRASLTLMKQCVPGIISRKLVTFRERGVGGGLRNSGRTSTVGQSVRDLGNIYSHAQKNPDRQRGSGFRADPVGPRHPWPCSVRLTYLPLRLGCD